MRHLARGDREQATIALTNCVDTLAQGRVKQGLLWPTMTSRSGRPRIDNCNAAGVLANRAVAEQTILRKTCRT